MFRNHDSPISLFSFQDIITCLTGIMLFLLLILAIRIMEIKENDAQKSPHRAEIGELRKSRDRQKRQLADMERDADRYRTRLNKVRRLDRTALLFEKTKLERELKKRNARIEKLGTQADELRRRRLAEESRGDRLRRARHSAEKELKSLDEAERRNRELRKHREKIRDEIARRRRTLRINVPQGSSKKPLVLECSRDQVRIVDIRGGRSEVIRRASPFLPSLANDLWTRLKKDYDIREFYFAVLIKPSAAPYAEYMQVNWLKNVPDSEFGFEPILESEGN